MKKTNKQIVDNADVTADNSNMREGSDASTTLDVLPKLKRHKRIRVFEGFAGYGGASCGLRRAGVNFEVIGYSENDKFASALFDANFGLFKDFSDEQIYGDGGSAFLQTNAMVRWYALSHGIPAESFAVGSSTLLMEFPSTARYAPLRLKVCSKADDELLFSSSITLHVGDVSQMVGWLNLRSAAGGSGGVPTRLTTMDWPPDAHESGNVVFVHGYNMEEDKEVCQNLTAARAVFCDIISIDEKLDTLLFPCGCLHERLRGGCFTMRAH